MCGVCTGVFVLCAVYMPVIEWWSKESVRFDLSLHIRL